VPGITNSTPWVSDAIHAWNWSSTHGWHPTPTACYWLFPAPAGGLSISSCQRSCTFDKHEQPGTARSKQGRRVSQSNEPKDEREAGDVVVLAYIKATEYRLTDKPWFPSVQKGAIAASIAAFMWYMKAAMDAAIAPFCTLGNQGLSVSRYSVALM
jgi:hypothetical protein